MCSIEIDCTQGFFLTNCLKSCGICEEVTEPRMMALEPICIPVPQVTTAPPVNPIQALFDALSEILSLIEELTFAIESRIYELKALNNEPSLLNRFVRYFESGFEFQKEIRHSQFLLDEFHERFDEIINEFDQDPTNSNSVNEVLIDVRILVDEFVTLLPDLTYEDLEKLEDFLEKLRIFRMIIMASLDNLPTTTTTTVSTSIESTANPSTVEPTTTTPATTAPATTAHTTTAPATTAPVTTAPATTTPTTTEQSTANPSTVVPTSTEPATTESDTTSPATMAPATTIPTTTDPTISETTVSSGDVQFDEIMQFLESDTEYYLYPEYVSDPENYPDHDEILEFLDLF